MPLAAASSDIVFLFASAGLVLYVASRAAVDSLTATDDPLPGRMAFAQWIPIAWAAILAAATGHSDIAITLVFATSVAVLALDLGVLTILAPSQSGDLRYARAWPFVLPAAILPLLAGFSSSLNWLHALMMLLLGIAVAGAWRYCDSLTEPLPVVPAAFPAPPPAPPKHRPIRFVQLFLAILLAGVGGWIAVLAMLATGQRSRPILATAIISPLLTLPVLGTGAIAAANRKLGAVTANLVGIVLLNLCALLPAVIFTGYIRQAIDLVHPTFASAPAATPAPGTTPGPVAAPAFASPATGPSSAPSALPAFGASPISGAAPAFAAHPATAQAEPATPPAPAFTDLSSFFDQLQPIHFPIGVWRIDCILIMALGLLLVPMSLGRWNLDRSEGLALTFGYVAYLIASAALAMRL